MHNMAVVACHLGDIPDTSDPETNEKIREPWHFLNIALKKTGRELAVPAPQRH
jgi:hypothetical protein